MFFTIELAFVKFHYRKLLANKLWEALEVTWNEILSVFASSSSCRIVDEMRRFILSCFGRGAVLQLLHSRVSVGQKFSPVIPNYFVQILVFLEGKKGNNE